MKTFLSTTLALIVASVCSGSTAPSKPADKAPQKVAGDYVEVRTASVFTGACHYNGELVTMDGHDAIMAWNFTAGAWRGVDLTGVRAMAAVTSDANLSQEQATRKVELVVDSSATDAQASAVAGLLKEKCGARLGSIVTVRRAPVAFTRQDGRAYSVKSEGYASMSVTPMPNGECCKQPHLVWYSPLTALENRKVGFTQRAAYTAGTLGDAWQREGENSAFYGSFAF
jgi:hypothetical protein